ncbi:glycosyltransferase family 1 protein [Crocosphaera sp.]|uniref:glycosyltransferase family 1 protein n=1 Tax=Crocosphaera sp. TaxID=2729996 RepID=UPI0026354AD7|nr:glycosyltransferase family 1 protein [Crocosphaera sp.]MDJ0580395.1 glycosyltransferase family 1 protein [Crocosphaera sp.]
MKTIYFYVPKGTIDKLQFLDELNHLEWEKIIEIRKFLSGNCTSWILTTYFHMKQNGFSCQLIDYIPESGILIADRDTLGNQYPYFGKVMLICVKGDREFHPSAHLHIVQNPLESQNKNNKLWNPYHIPIWPQVSLIPRSSERGSLVKNIAFMGSRSNFADEFKSEQWFKAIKELDCQWEPMFNPDQWNDYSNVDVVIAVRSFDGKTYKYKPASKLVNCWHAGVVGIFPPESAFMAVKKSELDFLIVNSLGETIEAVKRLKNDPKLYLSMIENGQKRKPEFSEERLNEYWNSFFNNYVFEEYEKWLKITEFQRRTDFINRYIRLKLDRTKKRIKRRVGIKDLD